MRLRYVLAALLVLASVTLVGEAQQPLTSNWSGANPRSIKFKPVDVNAALKPSTAAGGISIRTPNVVAGSNNRFLHNYGGFSGLFRTLIPSTPVLQTKDNPFQPNPPKGTSYFGAQSSTK